MNITAMYQMLDWNLTGENTIIIRADCNVPSENGIIIDDARLKALIPTLTHLIHAGTRIIILTHWGRPNKYDPALSTKYLVAWFNAHNIPMAFCASEADIDHTPIIMLENIRFLDEQNALKLIKRLQAIGTHYIHDGFSVMHRNDPFNTQLPCTFKPENRSLGMNAYQEIIMLDSFMRNLKKPCLGIFGGAKLDSKIDLIQDLSKNVCNRIALLPALCFPAMNARRVNIGNSFNDTTSSERIAVFEKTVAKNNSMLILPSDFLVSENKTQPPYMMVNADAFKAHHTGITFGSDTTERLIHEIDVSQNIIINGVAGFLEIPESLEPFKKILLHIAKTKSNATLIAGGETYTALHKLGLGSKFEHVSLAGGATISYCAGQTLPGLEALR